MKASIIPGIVAVGLIAAGCLTAAYVRQSAVLPPKAAPQAPPPPQSSSAEGLQYGGAIPIARELWIKGIQPPQIRSTPRVVSVAFDITASGAAKNCTVDAPEAQQGFGGEVCAAVVRNARFHPRRDTHGKAVSTRGWVRFRFEYVD